MIYSTTFQPQSLHRVLFYYSRISSTCWLQIEDETKIRKDIIPAHQARYYEAFLELEGKLSRAVQLVEGAEVVVVQFWSEGLESLAFPKNMAEIK